jgi:hypothetical protein
MTRSPVLPTLLEGPSSSAASMPPQAGPASAAGALALGLAACGCCSWSGALGGCVAGTSGAPTSDRWPAPADAGDGPPLLPDPSWDASSTSCRAAASRLHAAWASDVRPPGATLLPRLRLLLRLQATEVRRRGRRRLRLLVSSEAEPSESMSSSSLSSQNGRAARQRRSSAVPAADPPLGLPLAPHPPLRARGAVALCSTSRASARCRRAPCSARRSAASSGVHAPRPPKLLPEPLLPLSLLLPAPTLPPLLLLVAGSPAAGPPPRASARSSGTLTRRARPRRAPPLTRPAAGKGPLEGLALLLWLRPPRRRGILAGVM